MTEENDNRAAADAPEALGPKDAPAVEAVLQNDGTGQGPAAAPEARWHGIVEFLVAFVIMIGVIMAVRFFVVEPFEIPSGSMLNTIQIGDRVFSEKVSVAFDSMPNAGDIVTFINPRDASETLIKRVIATEGQTIDLRDGVVYVDGVALDEPYTEGKPSSPMSSDLAYKGAVLSVDPDTLEPVLNETGARTGDKITYPYTIPAGYFWVMGDNRTNSADSRVFGAVSAENVTGRAIMRYWPIFRINEGESVELGPLSLPSLTLAIGPLG